MSIEEQPIDESINFDNLTANNFRVAPTVVLQEYLRSNPTNIGNIALKTNNTSKIRTFNTYINSKQFDDSYAAFKKADWDINTDTLWGDENAELLEIIHKLSDEIGVAYIDADFKARIQEAYHDFLATELRNSILNEVAKTISNKKATKSDIETDIDVLKAEIRALETYAADFKKELDEIEANDAEIERLLAQMGNKDSGKKGFLEQLRSGSNTKSKSSFVKQSKQDEQKALLDRLAGLHAILALENSSNIKGLLKSQKDSQESVLQTLRSTIANGLNRAKNTTTDTIEQLGATAKRMPLALGESLKSARDKLRSTKTEPRKFVSPDTSVISENMSIRRKNIAEDDEENDSDSDFDFDDVSSVSTKTPRSNSGKRSFNSKATTPEPLEDQPRGNLLSDTARKLRLTALNEKLSQVKAVVSEQVVNSFLANLIRSREDKMQKHNADMAKVLAELQKKQEAEQKAQTPKSPKVLDRKKTHLFTGQSKEAASGVNPDAISDTQVRDRMTQVLRDIREADKATEKLLDALSAAHPNKKDEMEAQRSQLRMAQLGTDNPLFKYDFDEDHDGSIQTEQLKAAVELASNSYGVCETACNAARQEQGPASSRLRSLANAAWAAIQLVIDGLSRLIDMVASLFRSKHYEIDVIEDLNDTSEALRLRAENNSLRKN